MLLTITMDDYEADRILRLARAGLLTIEGRPGDLPIVHAFDDEVSSARSTPPRPLRTIPDPPDSAA